MNGTEKVRIPEFLEGEQLPRGYFDEPDPYQSHETGKVNLKALGEYVARTGKKSGWELSKEEMRMFESA